MPKSSKKLGKSEPSTSETSFLYKTITYLFFGIYIHLMKNTWLIIGSLSALLACSPASQKQPTEQVAQSTAPPTVLSSATSAADCAYLTTDHQNRPVVCW